VLLSLSVVKLCWVQDPTCARISVLGRMLPVEAVDRAAAQQALFAKHPAMSSWPADHGFKM